MGLYEGILGVKADYDGLRVEPCFPAAWESAEMTRIFRGARYHMMFKNPKQLEGGAATITVDGERLLSQVLPDFRDGRQHEVQVEIG